MKTMLTVAGALLCIGLPVAAQQASKCGPTKEVIDDLRTEYNETVVGAGKDEKGNTVIVTASPNGETWTALVVSVKDGAACAVAAGKGWKAIPPGKDM
ncbi:hypothetical protein KGP36_07845 [Patescibacteria group bacterium]|nr:hypothetical protein [Patescibacteria group bacterium]